MSMTVDEKAMYKFKNELVLCQVRGMMESSVLKSYHEQEYSTGVHSEAYSSEGSSYTQTSPEYDSKYSSNGNDDDSRWDRVQKNDLMNTPCKQESPDQASIGEEYEGAGNNEDSPEDFEVFEEQDDNIDSDDYDVEIEYPGESIEDENGPVIHIFAVDPEQDLEYSSDEEVVQETHDTGVDWCVTENEVEASENLKHEQVATKQEDTEKDWNVANYEANFPEGSIKKSPNRPEAPIFSEIIEESKEVKKQLRENDKIDDVPVVNVDDFFIKNTKTTKVTVDDSIEISDITVNETELPLLSPHLEEYKKLLFNETTPTKQKSFQKSFSLPHSPSHLPTTVDDGKVSLCFEDLNLHDLNDFNFDVDIRATKMFDIMELNDDGDGDTIRTLNDEDVNSFLITEPKKKPPEVNEKANDIKAELEDDLSQQDMEIECPVESKIDFSTSVNNLSQDKNLVEVDKLKEISPVAKAIRNVKRIPETSTPKLEQKKGTLLNFCIEKSGTDSPVEKPKFNEVKVEVDDFVDVESLSESVELPVLEANNVSSLLEQFEATEKFNNPSRKASSRNAETPVAKADSAAKSILSNGVRLQEAAIQLNKHKMRQILMPTSSPNCAVAQKPIQENVHADHDYCSPSKRVLTAPAPNPTPKRRQSLLKPEVLSSNNIIKSSRPRSCKSKNIVYTLSSDDEDSIAKKHDKKDIKHSTISNHRKKLSPPNDTDTQVSAKPKCRSQIELGPVISSASESKLSAKNSQCSSGSIKLTIKNNKVILNLDSDENKRQKAVIKGERTNHNVKVETNNFINVTKKVSENILPKPDKIHSVSSNETVNPPLDVIVKKEMPVIESYTPMQFYRNRDPLGLMVPEEPLEPNECKLKQQKLTPTEIVEVKQPAKKKLNLQEYRMRKEGAPSNSSSRTVSPEMQSIAHHDIFTLYSAAVAREKSTPQLSSTDTVHSTPPSTNTSTRSSPKYENDEPKKIFDPIREASRKILMQSKKQKAEAIRKREEDIVMSKIPKVENLELKPLISDVEMLEIVTKATEELQRRVITPDPPKNAEYEEIIMVSIGVNTDPIVTVKNPATPSPEKATEVKPPSKQGIQFKIKKPDQNSILKQNVFDSKKPLEDVKHDRKSKSPRRDSKSDVKTTQATDKPISSKDTKIDKERFKDITATLKRVENNSDVKISSNSLFASIQDTVMKKAPEKSKPEKQEQKHEERKRHRSENCEEATAKRVQKKIKTIIVNECLNGEHGEDKVILHLPKLRVKPETNAIEVQTEVDLQFEGVALEKPPTVVPSAPVPSAKPAVTPEDCGKAVEIKRRSRNDSGKSSASISSKFSDSRNQRSRSRTRSPKRRSQSRKSPSRDRSKRSSRRSYSRSRSRSRHRSRSYDRYRHSRYPTHRWRSRSPYKRGTRTPYRHRSDRRSPSYRRSDRRRHYRSRSRSRHATPRKYSSPVKKKVATPEKSTTPPPKRVKTPEPTKESPAHESPSRTPPLRKPTISESSDSSSSSSCSSSSSSSRSARSDSSSSSRSFYTPSVARSPSEPYHNSRNYSTSSSEDRQCIPPVEERRIVYVGKLETDITKPGLRGMFSRFGPITEVTLHTKDNGCKYGFVTFRHGRDAWTAVETARNGTLSRYDVGFGGRRAFCRQRYADLDGLEAKYRETDYLGMAVQMHQPEDVSFEVLLQETKKKLSKMKSKNDEPKV